MWWNCVQKWKTISLCVCGISLMTARPRIAVVRSRTFPVLRSLPWRTSLCLVSVFISPNQNWAEFPAFMKFCQEQRDSSHSWLWCFVFTLLKLHVSYLAAEEPALIEGKNLISSLRIEMEKKKNKLSFSEPIAETSKSKYDCCFLFVSQTVSNLII